MVFDDALIHRVIHDMGGWIALGTKKEDEWPFVAKEFENRYRGFNARGERPPYPPVLIGLSSAHNHRKGYSPETPVLIGNEQSARHVFSGGSDQPVLGLNRMGAGVRVLSWLQAIDEAAQTARKKARRAGNCKEWKRQLRPRWNSGRVRLAGVAALDTPPHALMTGKERKHGTHYASYQPGRINMKFNNPRHALRWAYETTNTPIIKISSVNAMRGPDSAGGPAEGELTAYDRHAQAALILGSVRARPARTAYGVRPRPVRPGSRRIRHADASSCGKFRYRYP